MPIGVFQGERPGDAWHAHGWTEKGLWVVHDARLVWVRLYKRRWRHAEIGITCHSRPFWDIPHSPYGLDVVFYVLGAWSRHDPSRRSFRREGSPRRKAATTSPKAVPMLLASFEALSG